MWLLTILLALALLGLLVLFCLKVVEQKGKRVPLLPWLRARGDEPVAKHSERAVRFVAHDARVIASSWLVRYRAKLVAAEVAALSLAHRVAARIHERLLHRKRHLSSENGAVSAHLKNVLESTKEASPKE